MRLLSQTSVKPTDKFILSKYPQAEFIADYRPDRNTKVYRLDGNRRIAKIPSTKKWFNGHRIVDKVYQIGNRYVFPFGAVNGYIDKNGYTVLMDKNKQTYYLPHVFVGKKELTIKDIKTTKNTIVFNYGKLKREVIINDVGFVENFIVSRHPKDYIKIIYDYDRNELPTNPRFVKDAEGRYWRMFGDEKTKYVPASVFDVAKYPITIDDSVTLSPTATTTFYQLVADCASITVADGTSLSRYVGMYDWVSTGGYYYETYSSFDLSGINGVINSATLSYDIYSYGAYSTSNNFMYFYNNNVFYSTANSLGSTYLDGTTGVKTFTFTSGFTDTLYIKFVIGCADLYITVLTLDVTQTSLYVEYTVPSVFSLGANF